MPINPSIALSYQAPQMPDIGMNALRMQQIQSAQQAQQMNALQMQQTMRTMQEQQAFKNALAANPDALTNPEGMKSLIAASPTLGLQAQKNALGMAKDKAAMEASRLTSWTNAVKNTTPEQLPNFIRALQNDPDMAKYSPVSAEQAQNMTPDQWAALHKQFVLGNKSILSPYDQARIDQQRANQIQLARHQSAMEELGRRAADTAERRADLYSDRTDLERAAKDPFGLTDTENPSPIGEAIKAGKTGEELLKTVPVDVKPQIDAMLSGQVSVPKDKYNHQAYIKLLTAVDPTFDESHFSNRAAYQKSLDSGKLGDTVVSFSNAAHHLNTLAEYASNLDNTDSPMFNKLKNFVETQTGKPAPTTFEGMKNIVTDEVVKAVIGSKGALGDRKALNEQISNISSMPQLITFVNEIKHLMINNLDRQGERYNRVTGKNDFWENVVRMDKNKFFETPNDAVIGKTSSGSTSKPATGPLTQDEQAELEQLRARFNKR